MEFEHEILLIESARMVVLSSFIVQRSLMPLDLNVCDYMFMIRPIITEEQYRNMVQPRRRILYTLHLDLPRDMERSLRTLPIEVSRRGALHGSMILVSEWVYNRDLAPIIVNDIQLAKNKTEKLRLYLYVMKLLRLDRHVITSNFIFDSIIHTLYPDCMDSKLVVEFAETFNFYSWILEEENPDIVGYVLEHARRLRYNIWASLEWRLDPINACIVHDRTGNIGKLLEYGTFFVRECYDYMHNLEVLVSRRINAEETTKRRFFLTQLLYVFMHNSSSWAELRSIWRSIPDPYLSANEIYLAFDEYLSSEFVDAIINYHHSKIVEENVQSANLIPRPLLHLSRVAVRNILSRNFQLPHGISKLVVGRILKNYLNLQC